MVSDSEEGEIGVGGSSYSADQDDHLEIKPPQRYSSEHRRRDHDRRSSEKRSSNKSSRHHNVASSKGHHRDRDSHERRRDERHERVRPPHREGRKEASEPRPEKPREDFHEMKETIKDAREKLTKLREAKQTYDAGEEELQRRRDRILAALSGTKRTIKDEPKEKANKSPRELPASYKQNSTDEEDEDAKQKVSPKKKRVRGEESTNESGNTDQESEETSEETGETASEDDEDDTADEARSSERVDRPSRQNSEDKEGVKTPEKMVVDSENKAKEKRDIREIDEFMESSTGAKSNKHDDDSQDALDDEKKLNDDTELVDYIPGIQGCRRVEEFNCLNRIEEGTYGVVYRALDKQKNEIVALKRLKMEKEKDGFPITSLREISTLLKAPHQNIVTVREIVVGSNMDKIYIVMDYVEHDLKSLMKTMKSPFLIGEVKTLMSQLLKAVAHLHDNWILHRDLKTSNLLLSHRGILKVGDFGLAREYGSPLKPYTPIVVTLWYRAPELLLGSKQYSCPIDVWSVGCIFAELLTLQPLFPGKADIDQLNKIFKLLGTPSEKLWTGYNELPIVKQCTFDRQPYNVLRKTITETMLTSAGFALLNKLLTYCPAKRISAEEALKHEWFTEDPGPIHPEMFPTWPAKSEGGSTVRRAHSPKPPSGGQQYSKTLDDEYGFHMTSSNKGASYKGTGFSLKF